MGWYGAQMGRSLLADAFAHHVWATLELIDACLAVHPEQLETSVPACPAKEVGMATSHTSVETYLGSLPEDQRTVLEGLRAIIRAAAPEATQQISYGMPAFKTNGRILLSYSAFTRHFSLFPASQAVRDALGEEITPFLAGKGTIRFTAADPLPADLVARIVAVRLAENAARRAT